jgi:hypothetical protein
MSELKKEFVPHTESLELKKLGFNKPCLICYRGESGLYSHSIGGYASEITLKSNTDLNTYSVNEKEDYWVAAPTYLQAFRWFRENYGLSGWVNESFVGSSQGVISIKSEIGLKYHTAVTKLFDTYEEAELECLKRLIEIVKQQTHATTN